MCYNEERSDTEKQINGGGKETASQGLALPLQTIEDPKWGGSSESCFGNLLSCFLQRSPRWRNMSITRDSLQTEGWSCGQFCRDNCLEERTSIKILKWKTSRRLIKRLHLNVSVSRYARLSFTTSDSKRVTNQWIQQKYQAQPQQNTTRNFHSKKGVHLVTYFYYFPLYDL